METIFYKKRSELTGKMQELITGGYTCFRVRVDCNCQPHPEPIRYPRANQRNGVLVVENDTIKMLLIRCKPCTPETETK
jgi:hypothetical protein